MSVRMATNRIRGNTEKKCGSFIEDFIPYILHPFTKPYWRRITCMSMMSGHVFFVSSIIYLTFNWDITIFINVGHTQVTMMYGAVIATIGFFLGDTLSQITDLKKDLWSMEDIEHTISDRMRKTYRFVKNSSAFMTVYGLLIVGICHPLSGDIKEYFVWAYGFDFVLMRRKAQYTLLFIVILTVKSIVAYAALCVQFIFSFIIRDITMQILKLRKRLQLIQGKYDQEMDRNYDAKYQEYIDDSLKKCISQHISILKYGKLMKSVIEKMIIVSTLLAVSCIAFPYASMKTRMSIRYIVNSIFYQSLSISIAFTYCHTAQLLMNECDKLHRDLCYCPWFLWNRKNVSKYIVFLINTREPITFTSLGLTLSHNYLVLFSQRALSFMACFERLTSTP